MNRYNIRVTRLILLAFCLAAGTLSAQPITISVFIPSPQLKDYLQLTTSQMEALERSDREHRAWTLEKSRRIFELQMEISLETAREQIDALTLGRKYAEIATICREFPERAKKVREANLQLLNDAQKAKLKALEDAAKLMPLISAAESAMLLEGTGAIPGIVGLFPSGGFSRTDGSILGSLSTGLTGCGAANSFPFPSILGPFSGSPAPEAK